MDLQECGKLARAELDGLGLQDWRLVVDTRPYRRLGQTRFDTRTIGITRALVDLNPWDIVRLTVRHEAAHALVGPGHGHSVVWKRQARALGVNPAACNAVAEMPARVVTRSIAVTCPVHGIIAYRAKMPARGRHYSHARCGQPLTFRKGRS